MSALFKIFVLCASPLFGALWAVLFMKGIELLPKETATIAVLSSTSVILWVLLIFCAAFFPIKRKPTP